MQPKMSGVPNIKRRSRLHLDIPKGQANERYGLFSCWPLKKSPTPKRKLSRDSVVSECKKKYIEKSITEDLSYILNTMSLDDNMIQMDESLPLITRKSPSTSHLESIVEFPKQVRKVQSSGNLDLPEAVTMETQDINQ